MPTPPVLLDPEFLLLWQHVCATLEKRGLHDRGWVPLPPGTPTAVRARLGDLDPDGVAITARLHAEGVVPWSMTAADYTEALAATERTGVDLREVTGPVPPTPWDPDLQRAMERAGRAVDEERVMDALLAEHRGSG